jgi:hypothetical protein
MLNKVNLFIVGAAKSGTTSLADLFNAHNDISTGHLKEPHFFMPNHGVGTINDYEKLYDFKKNSKYYLDASTGYLSDADAAIKILQYNTKAKIIIVLRNPINFCFSYWQYMLSNGSEELTFDEATSASVINYRNSSDFIKKEKQNHKSYLYLERGLFSQQIDNYINIFGSDKVKVVLFEDLISNSSTLEDIYEFLDIPSEGLVKLPKSNITGQTNHFIKFLRFSKHIEWPKNLLKKIIPIKFRYKVRTFLMLHTMIKIKRSQIVLSQAQRTALKIYFTNDVKKLKQRFPQNNFTLWEDFNE